MRVAVKEEEKYNGMQNIYLKPNPIIYTGMNNYGDVKLLQYISEWDPTKSIKQNFPDVGPLTANNLDEKLSTNPQKQITQA